MLCWTYRIKREEGGRTDERLLSLAIRWRIRVDNLQPICSPAQLHPKLLISKSIKCLPIQLQYTSGCLTFAAIYAHMLEHTWGDQRAQPGGKKDKETASLNLRCSWSCFHWLLCDKNKQWWRSKHNIARVSLKDGVARRTGGAACLGWGGGGVFVISEPRSDLLKMMETFITVGDTHSSVPKLQ